VCFTYCDFKMRHTLQWRYTCTYITFLRIAYALLSLNLDIKTIKHKLETKAVQSIDANKLLEYVPT